MKRFALVLVAGLLAAGCSADPGGSATENVLPSGRQLTPAGAQVQLGNYPTGGAVTADGRFLWTVSAGVTANDVRIVDTATRTVCQVHRSCPGASGGIALDSAHRRAYVSGLANSRWQPSKNGLPGRARRRRARLSAGPTRAARPRELRTIAVPPPAGRADAAGVPAAAGGPRHRRTMAWPQKLAVSPDGARLLVPLNLADSAAIVDLVAAATRVRLRRDRQLPVRRGDPAGRHASGLVTNEAAGTLSRRRPRAGDEADATSPSARRCRTRRASSSTGRPAGVRRARRRATRWSSSTSQRGTVERTIWVGRGAGLGTHARRRRAVARGRPALRRRVRRRRARRHPRARQAAERDARLDGGRAHPHRRPAAGGRRPRPRGDSGRAAAVRRGRGHGHRREPERARTRRWRATRSSGRSTRSRRRSTSSPASATRPKLVQRAGRAARAARPTPQVVAMTPGSRPAAARRPNAAGRARRHAAARRRPDQARVLHRPREPQLRPDARRRSRAATATRSSRSSARTSRPTSTRSSRASRCSTTCYANSEASIQGHYWTSAASVPDYVNRNWVQQYAGRGRPNDFGIYAVTWPGNGFLFDQAERAGHHATSTTARRSWAASASVPDRDRTPEHARRRSAGRRPTPTSGPPFGGCYASRHARSAPRSTAARSSTRSLPAGAPSRQLLARRLLPRSASRSSSATGTVPALNYLTLTSDHTRGTEPGFPTPTAMVADSDLAVGQLVDTISHSPIWSSSAIFIVEDDSQDGADHVNAHRIPVAVDQPVRQSRAPCSTPATTCCRSCGRSS